MRQETDYPGYRRIVRDSFQRWYEAGKDSWTGAPTNDKVTDFATAHAPLPGLGTRRVLDIGCGRGHQTVQLAERLDADVIGLDLLDVWDAPPPAHGTARFRRTDFLGFTDGPMDLLVDNGCLHHQRREEWPGWVEHGRTLLRPGGVWVVSCFLSPTPDVVAKPLADGRLNWWLTESAVTALFAGSGLAMTERTVIDRRFNYQGHWLKYLALAFVRS